MFGEVWFWCFVTSKFIGGMCPYTIPVIGPVVGVLTLIARLVFIVLAFFIADEWWYGLLLAFINIMIPLLTPRIDPNKLNGVGKTLSIGGSLVSVALTLVAYIVLFQ